MKAPVAESMMMQPLVRERAGIILRLTRAWIWEDIIIAETKLFIASRVFFGSIALLLCLLLPGCVTLWSEPNEQPIWLSLKDGSISFAWCGSEVGPYARMVVDSAVYDPDRESSYLVQAVGKFSLDTRTTFTLDRLPGELVATSSSTLKLVDARTTIFFYTGRDVDDLSGVRATFSLDSGAKFAESGRWRSPDGKERDFACDD